MRSQSLAPLAQHAAFARHLLSGKASGYLTVIYRGDIGSAFPAGLTSLHQVPQRKGSDLMALWAWIIAIAAFLSVIAAAVFVALVIGVRCAGHPPGGPDPQFPGRRHPPRRP